MSGSNSSATYRLARRVVISVVGISVVLLGVALLVLPGPGIVTIIVGLTILAVEFAWARRWLRQLRERSTDAAQQASAWLGWKQKE